MHTSGEFLLPVLQIIGKYESEGRILLVPLNGKGDINITLGKKRTKCTMQLYQQDCTLGYSSNMHEVTILYNHSNRL
jgi:hypothetical protein